MEHLTQEQLEAFVLGTSELEDVAAFRRHLSTCSICAQRLQHEARLDLWLHRAALEAAPPAMPARLPRFRAGPVLWRSAAALLLLAAGVWFLGRRSGSTTSRQDASGRSTPVLEVPGMMDPWATAPGSDIVSPQDFCLFIQIQSNEESTPGLRSEGTTEALHSVAR